MWNKREKIRLFLKKKWGMRAGHTTGPFCFYCNVDSTELRNFLIIFIGGLVLASLFVCIGVYLRGLFKNTESLSTKVLELETVDIDDDEHDGEKR